MAVAASAPHRVLVVSLGGTITMTAGTGGGVVPALSAADLLAAVPGLADLPAGFLDPLKARILLRATLAAGADRGSISAAFAAAGGCGDPARWPWTAPRS